MSETRIIDTKMHGRAGITAAFLLMGDDGSTALLETGPKSGVDNVLAGLRDAGVERLDAIIVTHIHLDHAGAAGTLVKQWPEVQVYVHEVGAPHLENPGKLWSSASRIYGDAMERLWGGIDPIPGANIHALKDGDVVEAGGRSLRAVETPGHAYHHHAYLDESSGALFTGDALGVRLPDVGVLRPATPPPEFHLTKAVESIQRIRALDPADVWLTHFGPQAASGRSVRELCDDAVEALRKWADWVRAARSASADLDEVTEMVRKQAAEHMEGRASPEAIDRLEQTTSYRMNVSGYMRYIDKNEGAA
jgi:glyoxylase-like metal-dependent hydrolase (beta-lactamase superfamily II)